MNLRPRWMIALLALFVSSPVLRADETSDKLDLILKEIKLLNERVSRLEQRVAELSESKSSPVKQPRIVPHPRRSSTPEAVIRLQTQSPASLMKGIHERERQLRQRPFPPEIFPQVPFTIPQPQTD